MTAAITNEELFRRLRKAEVNIADLQQAIIRLSNGKTAKTVAADPVEVEAPARTPRKVTIEAAPVVATTKIVDKYTDMDAEKLNRLVTLRGGNPTKIMEGFHARGRTNALKTWLRANKPKTKTSKPDNISVKSATKKVPVPKARRLG